MQILLGCHECARLIDLGNSVVKCIWLGKLVDLAQLAASYCPLNWVILYHGILGSLLCIVVLQATR